MIQYTITGGLPSGLFFEVVVFAEIGYHNLVDFFGVFGSELLEPPQVARA
jgi:hypothetical protein